MAAQKVRVRAAKESEHKAIVQIARTSRYLAGFTNKIYSGPERYEAEAIGVAKIGRRIVGFVCLRHCVRNPWTTIYDIGVHPDEKRKGVGSKLLAWAYAGSPWEKLRLNVAESNVEAITFYKLIGFIHVGSGAWKTGARYETWALEGKG